MKKKNEIDDLVWRQVLKEVINRVKKRCGNKIYSASWSAINETLSAEIRKKPVYLEDLK